MKSNIVLWLACILYTVVNAQNSSHDSIISTLDRVIELRTKYAKQKHAQLDSLKQIALKKELSSSTKDIHRAYIHLYEGYRAFRYDSAYYYLEKAKGLAQKIKDSSLIAETKIDEGFILISAGLFTEALDTLNSINTKHLDPTNKYDFYYNMARVYFDLTDYNDDERFRINYIRKGIALLNKALENAPENSDNFLKAEGLKELKQQNWDRARRIYLELLDRELSPDMYGVATSSLSFVYSQLNRPHKALDYLAMAAISDIEHSIQENTALRNLAIQLYENGELNKANQYVRIAFKDAELYNARHRRNQISAILPIIESAQLYKLEQKNKSLKNTVVLLTLLSIVVLISLAIIFKQLKDKKEVRKAISKNNERLQQMNLSLMESDAIKQDYITYFLKATSQLINKMVALQKNTILKVRTKKTEEILDVMQRYSAKKERNELFHQFDEVFLQLFPSFIESINRLFPENEKVFVKKGDLLSTELRIYALYRLGIQDNAQVAEFLDVSINTVYSYKTRLKSKSRFRDVFESKVMDIKRLDSKNLAGDKKEGGTDDINTHIDGESHIS